MVMEVHAQAREAVLSVLKEVQDLSGRPWSTVQDDEAPIGTLDGFDSLASIEATVLLETKLKITLKPDSVFLSPDGKRGLSLGVICNAVAKELAGGRR